MSQGTDEDHEGHAHDDDPEDSDEDDSDNDSDEDSGNGHQVHTSTYYINRKIQPVFNSLGLQRYVLLCSKVQFLVALTPEKNQSRQILHMHTVICSFTYLFLHPTFGFLGC